MFEVDGITIGAFQEVSGLQVELEGGAETEIKEGGQNEYIHRFPGRMKWQNLVLKRGTTEDNALFDWFREASGEGYAETDSLERKLAALAMVDSQGEIVRTWVFFDAFPVKWIGPKFAASSTEVATEQLEVAHHGFRVDI